MAKSINRVIKFLIISDFALLFGSGLAAPILAIFITDHIKGGDAGVAGIAFGIYWLSKAALQVPVGRYLDKNHGEKDDFYFLVAGTLLAALAPLGFIFSSLPWHVYIIQIFSAVGLGLALPGWCGIFSRHIDKGKEAQSWALDSSAIGIGAGTAGIVGGIIAKTYGFVPIFIGISLFGIIATIFCFSIKKDLKAPKKKIVLIPKQQ